MSRGRDLIRWGRQEVVGPDASPLCSEGTSGRPGGVGGRSGGVRAGRGRRGAQVEVGALCGGGGGAAVFRRQVLGAGGGGRRVGVRV